MATFRQAMKQILINDGLWPHEVDMVLRAVMTDENLITLHNIWYKDTDEYPAVVYDAALQSVNKKAVQWLRENKPDHQALRKLDTAIVSETESSILI